MQAITPESFWVNKYDGLRHRVIGLLASIDGIEVITVSWPDRFESDIWSFLGPREDFLKTFRPL